MVTTNAELEYDVSKALSEVKRLGIQLTRISRQRRWKYPVRVEWLEKLLRRYDENPGKPIVHLSDLPEGVHIALDEEGLAFLGRLWYKALERGRFREVEHWAHVLYEYGIYKRTNFASLSRLKRALFPLKIDVNALEPYVVKLRAPGQRSAKIVEIKSIPLDLRNVYAAAVMGYVGDAKIDDYTLLIGQKECFKDFETCIYEAFGKIRISNYDAGSIEHHHVSKLLSYVLSVAGYDVSKRQTVADNPAPLWFFTMDDAFKGAYLRRFWDAEGSSPSLTRRSLVLSQAVRVDIKNFISKITRKITFRKLPKRAREIILVNPPLSLISAQMLHMSLGIVSQVKPEVINVSKDGETSTLWKLFIYGKDEMEKFHDKIGFGIKQKMNALNRYLGQIRRTFSHRWEAYWKTLESAAKLETFTERELARAYGITVLSIRKSLRELKVNGDVIYVKRKRETREKIWKITQVGMKKLSTF